MPKLRTPDDHARQVLFNHTDTHLCGTLGVKNAAVARRRRNPGMLTLDEIAAIVKEDGITAEELYTIVLERGRLML